MKKLGIDTSNYATSLAVVSASKGVVCAKKRFLPVEKGSLGLRQSEALFHHTVALPELINEMKSEGVLSDITGVGVSVKPRQEQNSYMPCFLAGKSFAAAYSAGSSLKLTECSHQEGHVAAALYGAGLDINSNEYMVFHVSGGTTELLLCQGYSVVEKIGGSLDLYAGQAVDRLGVKLGYSFPAGRELTDTALLCDEIINPKISVKGTNCHFSGLQNQYERLLEEGKTPSYAAKHCLLSISRTLLSMAVSARKTYGTLPVVFAGGVMSSVLIKNDISEKLDNVYFVSSRLSSDNAVGVALIALDKT